MDRALLCEVDYRRGWRPAGIDPNDGNLQSYGWQRLPETPGPDVEIRVVEDDRDLEEHDVGATVWFEDESEIENPSIEDLESGEVRDFAGVMILEGVDEINRAIDVMIPSAEQTKDEDELREMVRSSDVDLDVTDLPANMEERIRVLKDHGFDVTETVGPPKIDPDRERIVVERR